MRMGVTAALPALGLVEMGSSRFNTMCLSATGWKFLESAWSGYRPHNRNLIDYLVKLLKAETYIGGLDGDIRVLSPLEPLSDAALNILREQILNFGPDATRRHAVYRWLKDGAGTDWTRRPNSIQEDHWHDLHAGARFFALRSAIFGLLNLIEVQIGTQNGFFRPDDALPPNISEALESVRHYASEYQEHVGDSADPNLAATDKLAEILAKSQHADALLALAERDGRVLIKEGRVIKPGSVFNVQSPAPLLEDKEEADEDQESLDDDAAPIAASGIPALPGGISGRVRNLFLMMADINGHLDDYL